MTEYEKAMLRLALLAATHRQALLSIAAHGAKCREADIMANEGKIMLDKAVTSVGKLL